MHASRLFGIALVFVLLTGCATPRTSTSTRLPMQHPYRLLLVRPDIQVRELTADGSLSFRVEWADVARATLGEQLQRALAAKAGAAVDVIGSERAGADPAQVAELHLRHDALGQLMPRPKTVGGSLGDTAINLGKSTGSDLLYIMHSDYTVRTTGRKAVVGAGMVGCAVLSAALLGGADVCRDPDAGDESAFASLVDAQNGEILWTSLGRAGFGDLRREKQARKLTKDLTRRLPALKPVGQ